MNFKHFLNWNVEINLKDTCILEVIVYDFGPRYSYS